MRQSRTVLSCLCGSGACRSGLYCEADMGIYDTRGTLLGLFLQALLFKRILRFKGLF